MRMPTLKDGDFVMWESNAINQYLASQKPESGLLPTDEKARLDVTRWQFWDLAHWDPACAVFVFEYLVKPVLLGINEQDPAALAKGTKSFNRAATVLDGQLKGRKFVTGDTLTLADFALGAPLIYADAIHLPLAPYAEIKRWYAHARRPCRPGRRRSPNAPRARPRRRRDSLHTARRRRFLSSFRGARQREPGIQKRRRRKGWIPGSACGGPGMTKHEFGIRAPFRPGSAAYLRLPFFFFSNVARHLGLSEWTFRIMHAVICCSSGI